MFLLIFDFSSCDHGRNILIHQNASAMWCKSGLVMVWTQIKQRTNIKGKTRENERKKKCNKSFSKWKERAGKKLIFRFA